MMDMNKDADVSGLVLKIERSSIHDGQGLRTVLFLKGCPLRCAWCSTPESQSPVPEIGYDKDLCEGCGRCMGTQGEGSLLGRDENGRVQGDPDKCSTGALKRYGIYMSVQDAVNEISKDEVFFFHSGGGITVSGGEPLYQPQFTAAVLRECKKLGIHRAMETCLFAPWHDLEMVLPWLNMLYVDIKLMDSALHRKWTGADNGLIHENLRRIDASKYDIKIIVRIPMIPGITDSDENLTETARFINSIKKLKGVELLPYHRLGTDTYKHLGREYKLHNLPVPSQKEITKKQQHLTQGDGAVVL